MDPSPLTGGLTAGVAMVDGVRSSLADAKLAITDEGVARGDGAFESVGVWDGRPFRLGDHLARLAASLGAIGLPPPDTAALRADVATLLDEGGGADGMLRCYVTASGTRVVALVEQPVRPEARHLEPQPAPWIRPLGSYGPAGAKTMSYAANMAATRAARRAGGDDALLLSLEGWVLEGPTFCVLWVTDGRLHAPAVDLGIVDSISRRTLLELAAEQGLPVVEGRWTLAELARAREVVMCSAVRDLIAARRVGGRHFEAITPVRDALASALERRRRGG
ncbi:MAG TPA: aminotransferase class IV [Egibacteraceae bacterium]|nr:aminotransferase class IV [Egibacteraceae bacterium]